MIEFHMPQGGPDRHGVLSELVKYIVNQTPTPAKFLSILEVGSFEGQSALVWGTALADYCSLGGTLLCIDPWKPYHTKGMIASGSMYNQMNEGLENGSVYARFLSNISAVSNKVSVLTRRGSLLTEFPYLIENSYNIVYVDGDHTASGVASDLALGRQLVKADGIICGDDLEVEFDKCDQAQALLHAEQTDYLGGYHPGVTVAVWKAFGNVWCRNGVWAMQKVEDGSWRKPEGLQI